MSGNTPPKPLPNEIKDGTVCPKCGWGGRHPLAWQQIKDGRWQIRRNCGSCRKFIDWPPQISPYLEAVGEKPQPGTDEKPCQQTLFNS